MSAKKATTKKAAAKIATKQDASAPPAAQQETPASKPAETPPPAAVTVPPPAAVTSLPEPKKEEAPPAGPVASQLPEKDPTPPPAKPVAPAPAAGKSRKVVVSDDAARYLSKHLQNYFPASEVPEMVPKILTAVEADKLVAVVKGRSTGVKQLCIAESARYSDRDAVRSAAAAQDVELLEIINQNLVGLGLAQLG